MGKSLNWGATVVVAILSAAAGAGGMWLYSSRGTALSAHPPVATAANPSAPSDPEVNGLDFTTLLNKQIPFVESKIGLAQEVTGNMRTYKIAQCEFTITTADNAVNSFTIPADENCANIRDVVQKNAGLPAGRITFGTFLKQFPAVKFHSDCISACGNLADPSIEFLDKGGRATNFAQTEAAVTIADDKSINASERLIKDMAPDGDDYVSNTKFNCDEKYESAAQREFRDVEIDSITIGYHLSRECSPSIESGIR